MATSGVNNTMQWELDDGVLTLSPVDGETLGLALCEGVSAQWCDLMDFVPITLDDFLALKGVVFKSKVAFENDAGDRLAPRLMDVREGKYYRYESERKLLTSLDVSGWDTSQVTDMGHMFAGICDSLTSLDVSGFDTSQVTDMSYMFGHCQSITYLGVSGFDTSQVEKMNGMFSGCDSLTSLNVLNFDTSQVADMSYMFDGCLSLTSLDVSKLKTSQVEKMNGMFGSCQSLASLDVSGFDTSKVTDMEFIFMGCSSLKTLDLRKWSMANIAQQCWSTIDMTFDKADEVYLPADFTRTDVVGISLNALGKRDGAAAITTVSLAASGKFRIEGNTATLSVVIGSKDGGTTTLPIDPLGTISTATIETPWDDADAQTVTITTTDSYGNTAKAFYQLPEDFYLLDFDKGGRSIGIGTEAAEYDSLTDAQKETGLLDVRMETRFEKSVSADSLTAKTLTATDTTTRTLTATDGASLTGDTTVTNGDESVSVLADTGAAPSGAAYTSGTYVKSNDFCVQVRESDGTLSEAVRLYQNTSGGSTASFGYGTDSTTYYNLADSFAITSHTLFSSKSFTSKAYADGSMTITKAGWYPLGIVGESVSTRYVTINRKYLESRTVGGATLKWMAENWDTSTHSTTASVYVLWARG